ncbi:MAG: 23S rRNA (uracil(1939)-C(5))-methyltransferase RlmD [Candidatus Methylumidiphilus sp.]
MSKHRNRKKLPETPVTTHIESFAHDLRGVAHVDGKAVFIDGGLPGESLNFVYTLIKRDFAEGRAECIITPSPHRIDPHCAHFSICGGCSLQHLAASQQLAEKQSLLLEQFRRIGKVEPQEIWPPLEGPHWGYRHKARLGVKWVAKKDKLLVGFREKSSPFVAELESCPVLHPQVGEHLRDLAAMIAALSIKDRVPQIEVAVGENRSALVFRVMEPPSGEDLEIFRGFGQQFGFDIYLQPKGPDSVFALWPENPPLLSYALPDVGVAFKFQPTDFTQVNVAINQHMVGRVLAALDPKPHETVLDLFCGIGNFTLPLAQKAGTVVGVEGGAVAVARARQNALDNSLQNVEFHVADLTQTQDVPWASRRYDKVLLDPSRAGAMEILAYARHWQARRIVYVSCNPATLARDAGLLAHEHGYTLVRAGVMDMFPHTTHVESIALFEKG